MNESEPKPVPEAAVNNMAEKLVALTDAARDFFAAAKDGYEHAMPADAAAFVALLEHGRAQMYLDIRVPNFVQVGFIVAGTKHAIWSTAQEEKATANEALH